MKIIKVWYICIVYLIFLVVTTSSSWSYYSEKGMIRNTIEVIENSWEGRDGAMGAWVDSAIAELILFRPGEILSWLSSREDIYNEFIRKLPYHVFTDYGGGSDEKYLLNLKESLIKTLKRYQSVDESTNELRLDLLKHLSSVEIRIID